MGIKVNLHVQHEGEANQCYALVNPQGLILKFAPTFKTKQAARRWCDRFGLAIEPDQDEQAAGRQQGQQAAQAGRPAQKRDKAAGQTFETFWDWQRSMHK